MIIMKSKYLKKRIRNSAQASVEIDYDKLANAIVKANRLADKEELQPEPKEKTKVKIFKGLWRLIKGDIDTEEQMTLGLFSLILSFFFFTVAIIGFIFALFVMCSLIAEIVKMEWTCSQILSNIFFIIFTTMILIIMFLISVIVFCAGREVEKSKDKSFIFNAFSGVVGLIALIVALIALNK